MARWTVVAWSVWLAASGVVAGQSASAPPLAQSATTLSLPDLEKLALQNNPTLAQADAEIEAARGRAKQAGQFPNPTIGYTGSEISRGPVINGGEHGLFVEQTIPLGGKLRLSRNIFEREAIQAEALREVQRARVLTAVRVQFYSALAAERRVETRRDLARLAAEAVSVSRQL